jgi:hypothetical protein
MANRARTLPLLITALMFAAAAISAAAQAKGEGAAPNSATLPDVVGIRPGMLAQEAYEMLKKLAAGAQIGVGQFPVAGVSVKPVPVSMAVKTLNVEQIEYITLWLTTPPSKQVVWAVGRTIEFDPNKQLLKSNVIAGLRQKYGPETDEEYRFWAFDQQGRRPEEAGRKGANCANRQNWTLSVAPPEAAIYDYVTPLMIPMGPRTMCDSLIQVRASYDSSRSPEYVFRVTVTVSDLALARSSQEAVQAYLANADAAKKKEEFEKAKQRKGPVF